MIAAVHSRVDALERYVTKVTDPKVDPELGSYLFRFGSVLVCGTLERSLELIILERLQHRAQPRVMNFIKSYFQRGTNYDCEAIKQLLMRFDSEWGRRFEVEIEKRASLSEGVSSCYAVRNSVAHGGGGSLGGTRLRELSDTCVAVIQIIEQVTT